MMAKVTMTVISEKSDTCCYVKIGECTICLEVSPDTKNKPSVSYWHGEMPHTKDVINMVEMENENG